MLDEIKKAPEQWYNNIQIQEMNHETGQLLNSAFNKLVKKNNSLRNPSNGSDGQIKFSKNQELDSPQNGFMCNLMNPNNVRSM